MIRSRLGLKALVLSGLVLGLMAFAVTGAQAETGSKWLVNGVDVGDLLPKLEIKEIENKTAVLEFTISSTLVEILCTAAKFDTGGKLIGSGGISLGTITFNGCVVFLNKVLSKNCQAHSSGEPNGEILTEPGEGLLLLDEIINAKKEKELTDLVIIYPDKKTKIFAKIEMGELCAIGELVNVETTAAGEGLWLKDIGGNPGALTAATTHLIVEADAPLHKLLALSQPALILGSAVIGLEGVEHEKLLWGGDWA